VTQEEARSLTKKILAFASVPEAQVRLQLVREAHLRFARNATSTSGVSETLNVSVTAWKGRRRASASAAVSTTGGDDGALKALVAQAEELAGLSPEDPEYVKPLGEQKYLEVNAQDAATAETPAAARAKAAGDAIAYARSRKVVAAGFLQNTNRIEVLANTAGLFAYFPSTRATFSTTARTPDGTGSGYASVSSVRGANVDGREAVAIATRKALESRGARELAPADYTAILEPQAVADLIPSFMPALAARAAEEGRSVFSAAEGKTRVGQKIFAPDVNLYTDPQHPVVPATSFAEDGHPTAKAYLARAGVLENLTSSRFWAAKAGRRPGPYFVNLILDGQGKSLADLIASVERGLLVTRLWYIRSVDPRQALVTGLTRDGTFYIEKGKVQYPVKNFRFNDSLVRMLGELEASGTPQRVLSFDGDTPLLLPPIRVRSFRFTSISDAV
jgi:predicted Zn-dependent protease